MTRFSPFLRSLKLVNSFWLPAAVFYFLDHFAFTETFGVPVPVSKFIDDGISFSTKVVFLAWIWGLIVEILSDEEPTVHLQNSRLNIKNGWRVVTVALLIPRLIHFLIFMVTGKEVVPLELIAAATNVFIAWWATGQIIRIKYGHLVPGGIKNPPASPGVFASGTVFLFAAVGLVRCLSVLQNHPWLKPLVEITAFQLYLLMFTFYTDTRLKANPDISAGFHSDKVLILVNPPAGGIMVEALSTLIMRLYPSYFLTLRALTPPEYRVIEYNRGIWNDRYYRTGALVAIGCFTSNCSDAYKIAKEFRCRGSKVVMGGPHVSFFPEEALEFCDSVVIGPAENVWEDVIHDYEKNDLKRTYTGSCPQEKLDRVYQYLLKAPDNVIADCLQISRGCKFHCYFCTIANIAGKLRMEKTVAEMIALIKKICYRKKSPISFVDNNIYADPAYAKEFLEALVPLKIHWGGSASIDIAHDDNMIDLLKRSGCKALLIGYEIIPESLDKNWGAKFVLAEDYLRLTRKLQKAGIQIKAHFMLGFPHDSWASLCRLWWFCFKLSPDFTVLAFVTPLPGAPFFSDAAREGKIINSNWRAYNIFSQTIDHPQLGRSWLFRKGFLIVTLFFLFTTSSIGRLILILFPATIISFFYLVLPK